MVTPLQSLRIQSSQFLLKALKENEQQTQSESSSTRSALLQRYGVDTSSTTSRSQKTLSALLDAMSPTDTKAQTETVAEISPDVKTASFMAGLKKTLEDMAEAPGTSKQAKSMLAALEAGTLTVTDPVKGVAIKAWDVDSVAEKNTESKTGGKIEATGWSDFLKSHLARDNSGAFARTAEGSYADTVTGGNAYFGTVGSQYVYLSCPRSKAAA